MNRHLFLFLVGIPIVIASIFTLTGFSSAQIPEKNQIILDKGVFIFVQTIVENSDGQLVMYLTSEKFTAIYFEQLKILLDKEVKKDDPVINIDGKKFQVIQRQLNIIYDKENVISSTIMAHTQNDDLKIIARFAHDGYPILSGEKVTSIWTFIRPVE